MLKLEQALSPIKALRTHFENKGLIRVITESMIVGSLLGFTILIVPWAYYSLFLVMSFGIVATFMMLGILLVEVTEGEARKCKAQSKSVN